MADVDGHDITVERPVRVVLCIHPDESRRALLNRALRRWPDIRVIGSTGDLVGGVDQAIDQLPDVTAISAAYEERLVLAVKEIMSEAPLVEVLVLEPDERHFGAITAGATGALPTGGSEIHRAVIGAHRGEAIIPASWARQFWVALDGLEERVRRRVVLTESEREVLGRLAEGETSREIAAGHEVLERMVNLQTAYALAKYHRAAEAQAAVLAFEQAATS